MAKDKKKHEGKAKRKNEIVVPADGDIANALVQAARDIRTLTSRELSTIGLYAGQEGVILALAQSDGQTAGNIAQALGVKPPTMTRTIARMEAQGFVERRDGDDGRLTTVWLTESGRQTVDHINKANSRVHAVALGALKGKQQARLMQYLGELVGNLDAALNADEKKSG